MSSPKFEPQHLPDVAPGNHGRTVAGWVTNGLIVLGALLAGIGFMIPQLALVWVGAGVVVVALAVGATLRALGFGQPLK
ncbi:MAG: hypothetical protein HGA51_04525 [Demequinaceae bacterium]|nr:hypothetical protein [Demequinaceae bacterium]